MLTGIDYHELKAEIVARVNVDEANIDEKIDELQHKIKAAREKRQELGADGDLRENSGYDIACAKVQQLESEQASLINAKLEMEKGGQILSVKELADRTAGSDICALGHLVVLVKQDDPMRVEMPALLVPEGVGIMDLQTITSDTVLCKNLLNQEVGALVATPTPQGIVIYELVKLV